MHNYFGILFSEINKTKRQVKKVITKKQLSLILKPDFREMQAAQNYFILTANKPLFKKRLSI